MKLKENLFHYFEQAGTKVCYHPRDMIYMQDDDAKQLYLIIKGRVRIYLLNSQGEEITLEIVNRGRIFGESSFIQNSHRPTTVQAIDDVELIACQLDDLYPFLSESKELTVSLLQLMSQTCDYLASQVKKAYTYNRYEKIAAFLLEQSDERHNNMQTLPFTHEEIASIIGLSRVTVSKILKEFQSLGYIKTAYRKIIVINKEALSRLLTK